MRLPWQARQYERTCGACGYVWHVPGRFARKGVVPIWGFTSGVRGRPGGGLAGKADLRAGMAFAEHAVAFRTCSKCGSEQYSQRPIRS